MPGNQKSCLGVCTCVCVCVVRACVCAGAYECVCTHTHAKGPPISASPALGLQACLAISCFAYVGSRTHAKNFTDGAISPAQKSYLQEATMQWEEGKPEFHEEGLTA